jgi:hypothetical protein
MKHLAHRRDVADSERPPASRDRRRHPLPRAAVLVLALGSMGLARPAIADEYALQLEHLRLNSESKLQADVIVRDGPPPERGEASVRFEYGGNGEVVVLVGLTAVGIRRTATTVTPLPCNRSQVVTATIVAPERLKGHSISSTLRRSCATEPEAAGDGAGAHSDMTRP